MAYNRADPVWINKHSHLFSIEFDPNEQQVIEKCYFSLSKCKLSTKMTKNDCSISKGLSQTKKIYFFKLHH